MAPISYCTVLHFLILCLQLPFKSYIILVNYSELDQLLLNCISITKYRLLFWKVIQILFSVTFAMESEIHNTFVESKLNTYYRLATHPRQGGCCWVTKIKFSTNTQENSEIETPSEVSVHSKHFTCERNVLTPRRIYRTYSHTDGKRKRSV